MSFLGEQHVIEIHFQANSNTVTSRSPSEREMAHGEGSVSLPAVVCTFHQPARGRSIDASGLMLQPERIIYTQQKIKNTPVLLV